MVLTTAMRLMPSEKRSAAREVPSGGESSTSAPHAASVSATKQRRIIFAARHYLMRLGAPPPCRFDVVVVEPTGLQWLQGAFDAG